LDKNARILVVDDDKEITVTIKLILEDEGYIVDVAATGHEAIQKSEETAYNLALLDIRLPDMEGVELLKLMKDPVPRTRKIMVTGYPSMQNAVTSLNNSADAYLIKPVDLAKLLATIKEQLALQEIEKNSVKKK
jgi:DNA-binding response OmpR family regulator